MKNHTIQLILLAQFAALRQCAIAKISIYALSAHGKAIRIFNDYLWAERLWKLKCIKIMCLTCMVR